MINFVIYVTTTGRIRYTGTCEAGFLSAQHLEADESIIEGSANLFTDYIVVGVVTARPANPATVDKTTFIANGTDYCTVSYMINPSVVSFTVPASADPIASYTDADSHMTFSALEAGTYTITLSSFPYLDKTFTLTAI